MDSRFFLVQGIDYRQQITYYYGADENATKVETVMLMDAILKVTAQVLEVVFDFLFALIALNVAIGVVYYLFGM